MGTLHVAVLPAHRYVDRCTSGIIILKIFLGSPKIKNSAAKIEVGCRVLIAGAGPIGVIMAQVASAFGASEVVVTDVIDKRLDFVKKYGANKTINTAIAPPF